MKFIVALLLLSSSAGAQVNNSLQASPEISSGRAKKTFFVKIDNEIKSTYNKAKNLDGYNGESELHLTQMLSENWGLDAGARWEMESRETSEEQAFTEAILGARFKYPTLNIDYSGLISYRPHINSGNTEDDVTLGTLEFLFKTSSYLSPRMKLLLKLKWEEAQLKEYLNAAELRKVRFDVSPMWMISSWNSGLQFRQTTVWNIGQKELSYLEMGPIVQYEGAIFKPSLRVLFKPWNYQGAIATNPSWASAPLYSFELAMNL